MGAGDKETTRDQAQSAALVSLENVSCAFGRVTAVDDLSLTVSRGEFLGIIGPNGAGKSTLIQLITGVIPLASGRIWLKDIRIDGRSPDDIASLAVARTFQTSRVFPGLSVWDSAILGTHVSLIGGGAHGRRINPIVEMLAALFSLPSQRRREHELEQRTEKVLKLFGDRLWPRRDAVAATLSYANRRRLEIARAIASEPTLLLLDEPMAGMNPTETSELADLLARLHATRPEMTVIIVEHKMDVIRQLCARVIVVDQGTIIAEGKADDVLEDPRVVDAYLGRDHTLDRSAYANTSAFAGTRHG